MGADLSAAEAALACGDYGQSLDLLEPLAANNPLPGAEGARIRMLMVTAWMGQGQEQTALATCRQLAKCKDPELRQRAKQLLDVLEAPSLQRPSNWSLKLPNLEMDAMTGAGSISSGPRSLRRNLDPPPPPPPPTGPTRNPTIGFAALVCAVLIGLTMLLSGCIRITTTIHIPGPDRVQLGWEVKSSTQKLMPWQLHLNEALSLSAPSVNVEQNSRLGQQIITAPTLPSAAANELLQRVVSSAATTAGLTLNKPQLIVQEQNWLLGVKQSLTLDIDLNDLPNVPGLNLSIRISAASFRNEAKTSPLLTTKSGNDLIWPLQPGEANHLELHGWSWNRLGVGSLIVLALLALSLILQTLRLKLGFGFPELPS